MGMGKRNYLFGTIGALILILATAASVFALVVPAKTVPVNPEAGLTDPQRVAREAQLRSQWQQHYSAWLTAVNIPKAKLPSLSKTTLLGEYGAGKPNLTSAVKNATFVLALSGENINFSPGASAVSGSVDRSLVGSAPSQINISETGGLRPTPDWKGMYLVEAPNAPLILPGDTVIVFLQRTKTGTYEIQSFTGYYRIANGTVQALEGNPFAAAVNGEPVATFENQILAAAAN